MDRQLPYLPAPVDVGSESKTRITEEVANKQEETAMKSYGCALAAGVCALAVVVAAAPAATIITSSNQTFIGKIVEETPVHIVIKTESGTVPVPLTTIATIQRDPDPGAPKIVPAPIQPLQAPQAFEAAKAAVTKGDWARAGSLLAGLLDLPAATFPQENRLAATAALVTCYLQIKDPKGAAKTFTQRANLVAGEGNKQRLLATAEAIENADTMMGFTIDGKAVNSYDEAIAAAMDWKTKQLLAEAKDIGAKATDLNDMNRLESVGKLLIAKLNEADLYSPGFSIANREAALASLADNIILSAKKAVELCTRERVANISRYWKTSAASVKHATVYNNYVTQYLGRREAAENGLKNLKIFAAKFGVPALYANREEKEIAPLLAQLDALQYHLMMAGMPQQMRIALRRIGSQFK